MGTVPNKQSLFFQLGTCRALSYLSYLDQWRRQHRFPLPPAEQCASRGGAQKVDQLPKDRPWHLVPTPEVEMGKEWPERVNKKELYFMRYVLRTLNWTERNSEKYDMMGGLVWKPVTAVPVVPAVELLIGQRGPSSWHFDRSQAQENNNNIQNFLQLSVTWE